MPDAEDLQRLLEARYEWEHADIETKPDREKVYDDLFNIALREAQAVRIDISRRTFMGAID